MINNFFNHYYKTPDNTQLHYATNFDVDRTPCTHRNVLIFNYGLVCSQQHWEPMILFFSSKGYKILLHHYRGHFLSDGTENISFALLAQDLQGLCEYVNIESAIVLGHSMGVNLSLEFALNNPQLITAAVLISGTVRPVENVMFDSNIMSFILPLLKTVNTKAPHLLSQVWKSSGLNPLVKKIIHQQGFNDKNVPLDYVEIYLNRVGKLGPELFIKLFDQMSKHSIINRLNEVCWPTLIIGGEDDNVIPNYQQKFLQQAIKKSELYIVKNASHVPQIDFPEFVHQRVYDFFVDHHINPTQSPYELTTGETSVS